MRAAVLHGPGDVRVEEREEPRILAPTDAILSLSHSCICGSDLWPWRGIDHVRQPVPMGHEDAGTVVEVGSAVSTIRPGAVVVGSFFASDNTCAVCRAGYQTSCLHRDWPDASQAERMRVFDLELPLDQAADGYRAMDERRAIKVLLRS